MSFSRVLLIISILSQTLDIVYRIFSNTFSGVFRILSIVSIIFHKTSRKDLGSLSSASVSISDSVSEVSESADSSLVLTSSVFSSSFLSSEGLSSTGFSSASLSLSLSLSLSFFLSSFSGFSFLGRIFIPKTLSVNSLFLGNSIPPLITNNSQ